MNEFKKILFKRKMLLVIILGILLKLILCLTETPPTSLLQTASERREYERIMTVLEGPLTAEKEEFFAEEEERRTSYQKAMDAIWKQYDNGELDEEGLSAHLANVPNPATVSDETWSYIQSQYDYVRTDPEKHYFINQTGWLGVIGSQNLDYVLLLMVLIISGTAITYEYECGMIRLLWTTKKGKNSFITSKIVTVFILCISVFLVSEGITAINEIRCYGFLPDAPIQSLQMFKNSYLRINLPSLYLASRGYKLLGVLVTSAITMCLSVIGRKSLTALFGGLTFVVVPYFLWGNKDILFRCPNPAGLLIGNGYFFSDVMDDSGKVFYKAVSSVGHMATVCIVLLLLCALTVGIVVLFKTKQERRELV